MAQIKKRTSSSKDANEAAPGQQQARRVIKKYPNRRLYDTVTSTYITLAEVKDLVMKAQAFEVRDAKTGDDLTRSILLQIILEEETAGAPLFTEEALANIIRFYGHALHGFMGSYLDKNVQAMRDMQHKFSEHHNGMTPEMWAQFLNMQSTMMQGLMSTYLEQSKKTFIEMQDTMQKSTEQVFGALGIKR
ncbi:MAG: polyhydroxyalkanoate synthesis repressor PhaR [Pseudomonadota bacterium]